MTDDPLPGYPTSVPKRPTLSLGTKRIIGIITGLTFGTICGTRPENIIYIAPIIGLTIGVILAIAQCTNRRRHHRRY